MDRMTDDDRQESVVVKIVVDGTDLFEQVKGGMFWRDYGLLSQHHVSQHNIL